MKSEKQIHDIIYTWNLKCGMNEPIYKTDIENRLVITKGEEATERDGLGVCSGCKLLQMEWLTTRPYCTEQGTITDLLGETTTEENLKKECT